ncbi:hypothetical protein KBB42_02770 [Candidatus Dojkabacteria bacterium]|nr:hypothetical protein [Candidatus Dojkabacteria bacterium]
MIDPTNTTQEKEPIRDIRLEPGIYDFTPEIRDHIINGTPFNLETLNVLRTFDQEYDFDLDIKERGKQVVLAELDKASEYFDFEIAKQAVNEGLKIAQIINPDVPIKPFPVVFLYIPYRGDAKSLHGQGCGINIGILKNKRHDEDPSRQKIVSFTAHEATHTFLKQLGQHPEAGNRTWRKAALDFIWEEGLTTYVEPTHYLPHDTVEADGAFWVDIINRWYNRQNQEEAQKIYEEIKARPSFQTWYNYMYYNQPIPDDLKLTEENFQTMLRKRNGIGYHVGSYLWKRQLEKGKPLKDLVMEGSKDMDEWMTTERNVVH